MYHIKDDIRQRKSAALITETALSSRMAAEHSSLTISAVCSESGVSRSTFYRLFDCPDDIIRFYTDNLFAGIHEEILSHEEKINPFHVYAEHFMRESEAISSIMKYGKVNLFMDSHRKMLTKYAPELFPDMDTDSAEFTYFVEMRTSVIVGALRAWFRTGQKSSPEDVIRYAEEQLKIL